MCAGESPSRHITDRHQHHDHAIPAESSPTIAIIRELKS